jgi:enamine deaminase RidA (YjgF/YER057c/UK114 family)
MSGVADRLAEAGLELPPAPQALGAYVPAVRTGLLVFTAGQLPMRDGRLIATGHVGAEVEPDLAGECATQAALNALAAASTVCDLDDVERVVRLTGYVSSAAGFIAQPAIVDAASRVLAVAFGDAGRHARSAVGVAELPLGAPVELEVVLALRA